MKMKRADFILAGSVLLLAAALFLGVRLFSHGGDVAVVRLDGEEVLRLDLSEDKTVTVGETHTLVVKDGGVTVTAAPCPDQICVKHPEIRREGETIVCLPYRLTVTVEASHEP